MWASAHPYPLSDMGPKRLYVGWFPAYTPKLYVGEFIWIQQKRRSANSFPGSGLNQVQSSCVYFLDQGLTNSGDVPLTPNLPPCELAGKRRTKIGGAPIS